MKGEERKRGRRERKNNENYRKSFQKGIRDRTSITAVLKMLSRK